MPRATRTLGGALVAAGLVVAGVSVAAAGRTPPGPPQPGDAAYGVVDDVVRPIGPPPSDAPALPQTVARTSRASREPRSEVAAPVRVRVPAIGVDARVVRLGLARGGALEVPHGRDYDAVGWYVGSPRPGGLGPAVLAGHVDSSAGPSVFFRLGALRPGDRVAVDRADGSTVEFRVTAVRRVPKDGFPTALVYGDTADAQLRLITCGGVFDAATGHYRDNVVVFAAAVR